MRRTRWIFLSLLLILAGVLWQCGSDEERCVFTPPVEKPVPLKFSSLTDSLMNIQSKGDLVRLLSANPVLRDVFFKRMDYPNDSVFINELYRRFTHPHLDTLHLEVQRVFGNQQALQEELQLAFTNLRYYFPEVRLPEIHTAISGLETDLVISDSLIIIGLDYYLGEGARYRPNMYDYLLRQYTPHTIAPSIMLLYGISDKFNKTDPEDKTVLADMVAYGKSFYFARHMLPCVPDSIFIWYSTEEVQGAKANADLIWLRLVEDQVLYATSHLLKQKYLGDRPKTVEVGEKCPGRIGQWVGWEIVKSYMKAHPETSLPQLMNVVSADELFKESRYRPEGKKF